jgi:hypothetical protein
MFASTSDGKSAMVSWQFKRSPARLVLPWGREPTLPFSSPSTAAAVALGRSSNGRLEWKSAGGGTYGDWENCGVE